MSTPESSWERSTTRPVFTVIDPELDRGFISNGGAARLTIFNTNTLETIGQVKSTGENPGRPSLIPRRSVSLPFNLNSHNATVVDSKESKVVGAFDLGGRPELVGSYRVFERYARLTAFRPIEGIADSGRVRRSDMDDRSAKSDDPSPYRWLWPRSD
jgi:hypothetical protein